MFLIFKYVQSQLWWALLANGIQSEFDIYTHLIYRLKAINTTFTWNIIKKQKYKS